MTTNWSRKLMIKECIIFYYVVFPAGLSGFANRYIHLYPDYASTMIPVSIIFLLQIIYTSKWCFLCLRHKTFTWRNFNLIWTVLLFYIFVSNFIDLHPYIKTYFMWGGHFDLSSINNVFLIIVLYLCAHTQELILLPFLHYGGPFETQVPKMDPL